MSWFSIIARWGKRLSDIEVRILSSLGTVQAHIDPFRGRDKDQ